MSCCKCCCKNERKRNECHIDGKGIAEYDLCHFEYKDYGSGFSYIGAGIVYSVNGKIQYGKSKYYHFWVKL